MSRVPAALAVVSTACWKLQAAKEAYRDSRLALIEIKKDEALDTLKKHPEHAETVLDLLVSDVVEILQ